MRVRNISPAGALDLDGVGAVEEDEERGEERRDAADGDGQEIGRAHV